MPHIVDQFAYNEDQKNHFKDYNYHGGIYVNICVTEIVVFQTYYRIIFVLKTNSMIKQYVCNQFVKYKSGTQQRYTYRVLQTIHMKSILLCVWAEPAVFGSTKTALKFRYEI